MSRRPYSKFLLAGVSAAAVLVGAQVANADDVVNDGDKVGGVQFTNDFTADYTNPAEWNISGPTYGVLFEGAFTGNFTNEGDISADSGAGVYFTSTFDGNFINSGNITATGSSGAGVNFDAFEGDFTNSGEIEGNIAGVYFNSIFDGDFTNEASGNISATGTSYVVGVRFNGAFDGEFTNSGEITATSGTGVYFNDAFGSIRDSSFTNSGNISGGNSNIGVWFADAFAGDFTNEVGGEITGGSTGVYFQGAFGGGKFANSGTISGSNNNGVWFEGNFTGEFTNEAGGTITGGTTGVYFGNTFEGEFTNSGEIKGNIAGVYFSDTFDGSFTNSGDISATATGTNTIAGVFFGGAFTGEFTNEASGNISADSGAGVYFNSTFDGNFANSGKITGTSGTGVYFFGAFGGNTDDSSFTNSGNITGDFAGVVFDDTFDGNFINEVGGEITGGTTGVWFSDTFTGEFTNSGTIIGGGYGVYFDGAFGSDTGPASSFTNSGNITATATGTDIIAGVFFGGAFTGDFTNEAGGNISADSGAGVYFNSTFDGNFTNSRNVADNGDIISVGNITGGDDGVWFEGAFDGSFKNEGEITGNGNKGVGVWFEGAFDGSFTNSGNISGDWGVFFNSTFDGTFTNSGKITATGTKSAGVWFNERFDGNFKNEGNISGGTNGVYFWYEFTGNFINEGSISGGDSGGEADGVQFYEQFKGSFTNSGKITGSRRGVYFVNTFTGNFTNEAGGTITGDAYGVHFGGAFDGTFTNTADGIISSGVYEREEAGVYFAGAFGSDPDTVSSFTNRGEITASGDDAVDFDGAFVGEFTNSGTIKSFFDEDVRNSDGDEGVDFDKTFDGTFTNEAGGTITGVDDGVNFAGAFGSKFDSSFTNSGDITGGDDGVYFNSTFIGNFINEEKGNIKGNDDGVYFREAFGSDPNKTDVKSSFTNSGDITAAGEDAYSVYFRSTFDGSFTNSGTIIATGKDAYGVFFKKEFGSDPNKTDVKSTFTNSGTITTSATGHALWVAGDFTGDLINTGNISGTSTGTETNYIYIGNFTGNMTQPVGVRVDVGDYGSGNGTADLSGKTYTAYVDGFVDDGYGWEAIRAGNVVDLGTEADLDEYELTDTSYMVEVVRDDDKSTNERLFLKVGSVNSNVSGVACSDHGLAQKAEQAVEGVLKGVYPVIQGELQTLIKLLYSAGTADDLAAVIEDYSPLSGAAHGVLGNSQRVTDQLADRLRPNSTNGLGAWGSVLGGTGDLDACSGHATITAGAIGGFESRVNETTKVGVALAYLHAGTDGKGYSLGDEVNINTLSPALYARYQPDGIDGAEGSGGLYAQGSVAGAYSFIDQTRTVLTNNGERFEADYEGVSIGGRAEIGYDAPLGQGYLTPYAAAGFNLVALDGYSESGAGDTLDVSGFDDVFPVLEGGLRAVFVGEQAELSAKAGYRHEFGKEDIRASLGTTSFDTTLHSVGSGFMTGLGINVWTLDSTMLGFSYDGLFGADRTSHVGSVTASFHM